MSGKFIFIIPLLLACRLLNGQAVADAWMNAQLEEITWQESFKGVLADYHPIILELATDQHQVAGYLIHDGDQRRHKLIGDWSKAGHFQLQERDEYDRLTGYLTGSITNDQVQMKWMSADQSRLFDVKAFPERLIKIKNFKPTAEWIVLAGPPAFSLSVQKMDYGIVSGIASFGGHYSRFDGQCLDGTCSIWKTMVQGPDGELIEVQMRQKDQVSYKATIDGIEYKAALQFVTPLAVKQYDNSTGFLDFVYPLFESKKYEQWLGLRIDSLWNDGIRQLGANHSPEDIQRLAYRSSGWVEIVDEGESYVSGMITFINPDVVHREAFLWLRKEDEFISQQELTNTPDDLSKASGLALASTAMHGDDDFQAWLTEVGYSLLVPTVAGVAMATEFNMIYGDELSLLSPGDSKLMIKRKYWKYFGW
jgi:hypothetical protein